MKRPNIITSYDNLLSEIERFSTVDFVTVGNRVQFKKKIEKLNKGYLTIQLESQFYLNKIAKILIDENKFNVNNIVKYTSQIILLSSKEVILYRILLSNYILNEVNGKARITLDEIHRLYRNKFFKYASDKYDKEILQAYTKAFERLCNKTIDIAFGESKIKSLYKYQQQEIYHFNHTLLQLPDDFELSNIANCTIEYSLGKFGDYLKSNRQYNMKMPRSIYEVRFNQINVFNMCLYICRMIYINKRGRKTHRIFVNTILQQLPRYLKNGYIVGNNYGSYLTVLSNKKRVKLMTQFKKQMTFVLEELVKAETISSYEIVGKWTYKYMIDKELYIKIKF